MSGLPVPHSHWRRCIIGWRRFTWLGYTFPIVTGGRFKGAPKGAAEGISGFKSLYVLNSYGLGPALAHARAGCDPPLIKIVGEDRCPSRARYERALPPQTAHSNAF